MIVLRLQIYQTAIIAMRKTKKIKKTNPKKYEYNIHTILKNLLNINDKFKPIEFFSLLFP